MAELSQPAYTTERPLPAELALAAACCHWPPSPEGDERVRAAAADVRDWERFDGLVRRNRIHPLVQRALTRASIDLPPALAEGLSARSRAASHRALVLARESVRLQRAFEGKGIPSMIVKGIPLAVLAYGEIGLKEAADIDLLVTAENALEARHLLQELGGKMLLSLSDSEFLRFVEHDKELVFLLDDGGITVELHWRLVTHRTLLGGADARGPDQVVNFPGGALRTLADEPLFAFLCLHGAFHNWSRLKWLADVGAFLGGRSAEQIEQLYRSAQTYGAGRSAGVAILLCRRLFGIPLAPELLAALPKEPIARALADNVIAGLSYREGTVEHEGYSAPWLRMRAAQYFLEPGVAHAMDHAHVTWVSALDRAQISLPRGFAFLYHLLRVPLWFRRAYQNAAWLRRT